MPSHTFVDNEVLDAADVNKMNQDPQQITIATDEATTSTSYVNLSTVGPTVTINLDAGQKVAVWLQAWVNNAGSNSTIDYAFMSFAVSGASTQAAADARAVRFSTCKLSPLTSVSSSTCSAQYVYTAVGTGSHTFQAKYRTNDAAVNQHFVDRSLAVFPKF